MIVSKKSLPRRTFLRGLGTTMALPLLDSMIPALGSASAAKPIVRLGYVYHPVGMILDKWIPATEGTAAIHPDAKGNLYIDPKVFPSAVAADLPPKIAESLANSQMPLSVKAFETPVDVAAWRDKPTFYVITTKDKVIAPEAQKLFATRMHAQITEVAGSHASLVVHAKEVAAVIEEAARSE